MLQKRTRGFREGTEVPFEDRSALEAIQQAYSLSQLSMQKAFVHESKQTYLQPGACPQAVTPFSQQHHP